jgi:hypothetical protein
MNLEAFKSYRLYLAIAVALGGILLTQGVLVEGSTAAQVLGWLLTLLGSGTAGAQAVKPQQ